MTKFEPRISNIGWNRSANWATTNANIAFVFFPIKIIVHQAKLALFLPTSTYLVIMTDNNKAQF